MKYFKLLILKMSYKGEIWGFRGCIAKNSDLLGHGTVTPRPARLCYVARGHVFKLRMYYKNCKII